MTDNNSWVQVDSDDLYPHIHCAVQDEETADVIVIEEHQQPWHDDDETEFKVRKTPSGSAAKVLDEIADGLDTYEEAVAAAEEYAGAEVPCPDSDG